MNNTVDMCPPPQKKTKTNPDQDCLYVVESRISVGR
jgi:hypothetical protein